MTRCERACLAIASRLGPFVEALRLDESLLLVGFPLGGLLLGTFPAVPRIATGATFLVLVCAGVFHIYALNDLLGYAYDRRDPGKAHRPLVRGVLSLRDQFALTAALGALWAFGLAVSPWPVAMAGIAIELVWLAYDAPRILLKRIPVLGTLLNFAGTGFLPFLLGYARAGEIDGRAVALAAYAGALAGAGQLNREVIDLTADRAEQIQSTAVRLGRARTHRLSLAVFAASSAYLVLLGALGLAPWLLVVPVATILPLHIGLFVRRRKRLDRREELLGYIRGYRALYAFAGLAFLVGWWLT